MEYSSILFSINIAFLFMEGSSTYFNVFSSKTLQHLCTWRISPFLNKGIFALFYYLMIHILILGGWLPFWTMGISSLACILPSNDKAVGITLLVYTYCHTMHQDISSNGGLLHFFFQIVCAFLLKESYFPSEHFFSTFDLWFFHVSRHFCQWRMVPFQTKWNISSRLPLFFVFHFNKYSVNGGLLHPSIHHNQIHSPLWHAQSNGCALTKVNIISSIPQC